MMRWGISNGGRSARALGNLPLAPDEVLWDGDLPGNPYDEFDAGLVIDAGQARARTAAEVLAEAKKYHVNLNRAEASRRILAKYSDARQRSAALGLYPEAYVVQMQADIAAVIQAENTAADAIDAATTIAQVEAVSVSWPVI